MPFANVFSQQFSRTAIFRLTATFSLVTLHSLGGQWHSSPFPCIGACFFRSLTDLFLKWLNKKVSLVGSLAQT